MAKKKKLILVDLDGTLYDFKGPDNQIISAIFGRHKLVLLLDKALWFINGLDLISNAFYIFKLRIFIYSLLSFSSYKNNMNKYVEMYHRKIKGKFLYNYETYLKKLNTDKTAVVFVTHDPITKYFKKFIDVPIVVLKRKNVDIPVIFKEYEIILLVGNNFSDDIMTGLEMNKIYQKREKYVTVVYIGSSKLVRHLIKGRALAFYDISQLDEYSDILLSLSEE